MHTRTITTLLCTLIVIGLATGCGKSDPTTDHQTNNARQNERKPSPPPRQSPIANTDPEQPEAPPPSPPLVAAARSQVGITTIYDGAYAGLEYPGGDVPIERGVCTDVVIRAMRSAFNMDLQQLVHEDMKANFDQYPKIWGLSRPDKNIDHRRVPNLQTYFKRMAFGMPIPRDPGGYKPGDVVTCMVGNRPHIMVVSDKTTSAGVPLVIHNIGRGTQEEDRLSAYRITGCYRVKPLAE